MAEHREMVSLGRDGTTFKGLDILRVGEGKPPLSKWVATCTEFTCRCPITKQPDWAEIIVVFHNSMFFVETKSLKLYLETFREVGIFHEHLAQEILDTIVGSIKSAVGPKGDSTPYSCEVRVKFNLRGGIGVEARALYSDFEEDPK